MTRAELSTAMDRLAKQMNVVGSTDPASVLFAPVQLPYFAALLWVRQIEENADTRLIRAQLRHLWNKGCLMFDEEPSNA